MGGVSCTKCLWMGAEDSDDQFCPKCGADLQYTKGKDLNQMDLRFNGPEYSKKDDQKRLTGQIKRIYDLMVDEKWRTLGEIEQTTGDPQASISAQLRHLRKERFGSHQVDRRRRGERPNGLCEYRLIINDK